MTTTVSNNAPSRPFQGWKVLGVCTFSQFVAIGCTMYLIGIFIEPLAVAFSATRGQIGSASGVFAVFGALLGPLLGYLADKGHTRKMLLAGAVAMSAGLVLLSQVSTLMSATLVCVALLAPAAALLGTIPTTVMVAQWFEKRRGLAIGITAAGISAGGFFMPPLAAWLLELVGWRETLMVLGGAIVLTLLPLVWRLAIVRPADVGQYVDGGAALPTGSDRSEPQGALAFGAIANRADFWIISVCVGIISFFGILTITYLTPFAKESGMTLQQGALMLSLYAISGVTGKFACGALCDYLAPRRMLSFSLALAAVGWLPVLFTTAVPAFLSTAFFVGFAMGGLIPVWSSLIAVNFGLQNFGRVRGLMSLMLVIFTVLPGPLGGYLYDTTGSFATAFTTLWYVLPVGVLISFFVTSPPKNAAHSGPLETV